MHERQQLVAGGCLVSELEKQDPNAEVPPEETAEKHDAAGQSPMGQGAEGQSTGSQGTGGQTSGMQDAGLVALSVAIGVVVIGAGADVAQVVSSGSRGAWWLVALIGLVGVIFGWVVFRRRAGRERKGRAVALGAAVVGVAALVIGGLGAAGLVPGAGPAAAVGDPSSPAPPPSPPTPLPTPEVKTEITAPGTGDVIPQCVNLRGTAHVGPHQTLVLSIIRESVKGADYYFQTVDGWEEVASRSSWTGTQYPGNQTGQRFKVQLLTVDLDTVRAELDALNSTDEWHSKSLLKGSVSEDTVTLKRGKDVDPDLC